MKRIYMLTPWSYNTRTDAWCSISLHKPGKSVLSKIEYAPTPGLYQFLSEWRCSRKSEGSPSDYRKGLISFKYRQTRRREGDDDMTNNKSLDAWSPRGRLSPQRMAWYSWHNTGEGTASDSPNTRTESTTDGIDVPRNLTLSGLHKWQFD
jgi:hypothetical protein